MINMNKGQSPRKKEEGNSELGLESAVETSNKSTAESSKESVLNSLIARKEGKKLSYAPPFESEEEEKIEVECDNTMVEKLREGIVKKPLLAYAPQLLEDQTEDTLLGEQTEETLRESRVSQPGAYAINPEGRSIMTVNNGTFADNFAEGVDQRNQCTSNLPVGVLVNEDYPEAQIVIFKRIHKATVSIVLFIVIAVAVVVPIALKLQNNEPLNSPKNGLPTPTSNKEKLRSIIESKFPPINDKTYRIEALVWLTTEYESEKEIYDEEEVLMKYCLLSLFYSTVGSGWTDNTNWRTNATTCDWYGIKCGESDDIIELKLSNNNLMQSIPDEIGHLQSLKLLDISNNEIKYVSEKIASLQRLETLDVRNNKIKYISEKIGSLRFLDSFWVYHNELIYVAEEIKELVLSTYSDAILNKTGTVIFDSETPQNRSFQRIRDGIENDKISVNEDLRQRYALTVLFYNTKGERWDRNKNWLFLPRYCDWENIRCNDKDEVTELYLHKNHLVGSIPKDIGFLTSLFWLRLNENSLTGKIPTEMGLLTSLEFLYIWGNQLNGMIPRQIAQLKQLKILMIDNNRLSGSIPDALIHNNWLHYPTIDCDKISCGWCLDAFLDDCPP